MKLSKISNLILLRIRNTEIHHGLKVAKNHSHRILKLKSFALSFWVLLIDISRALLFVFHISESHDYTIRSGKNLLTGSGPFLLNLNPKIRIHYLFRKSTTNALSIARISFQFTIFFANWLSIHYFLCEFTFNSLFFSGIYFHFTIFFAN